MQRRLKLVEECKKCPSGWISNHLNCNIQSLLQELDGIPNRFTEVGSGLAELLILFYSFSFTTAFPKGPTV